MDNNYKGLGIEDHCCTGELHTCMFMTFEPCKHSANLNPLCIKFKFPTVTYEFLHNTILLKVVVVREVYILGIKG